MTTQAISPDGIALKGFAEALSPEARPHLAVSADLVVPWELALALLEADARDEERDGPPTGPAWLEEDDRYWLVETLGAFLPPPNDLTLEVGVRGVRGRPGYALDASWKAPDGLGTPETPERLSAGVIRTSAGRRRLTLGQLRVLAELDALPPLGVSKEVDLDATARLQAAAEGGAPSVVLGPGLRVEDVRRVDAVQPHFVEAAPNAYRVMPSVPGIPDTALYDALRRTPQARWSTGLSLQGDDGRRIRPVFDANASLALREAAAASQKVLSREQVAQVIASPEQFLGKHLDLSVLSDRVASVGAIVMEARIERSEVGVGGWTEWGLVLEDLDGEHEFPLDLADEAVVSALEDSVARADREGTTHIPNPCGPGLIQVTLVLRDAVRAARKRLNQKDAEPEPKLGLQVRDNLEEVEYFKEASQPPEPVVLKQPRGIRRPYRLKDHQLHGLAWLRGLAGSRTDDTAGGLLADDMGLGKTLQVLALWSDWLEEGRSGPHLIVAPVALLHNWRSEAKRFFGQRLEPAVVFQSADAPAGGPERVAAWLARQRIVMVSYETLRRHEYAFAQVHWDTVVLDEAQKAKNPTTQISRVVRTLRTRLKLAVTGTPVENSLRDMWTLFDWAVPGLLGSLRGFRERYVTPIAEGAGDDVRAELASSLTQKIESVFLRRLKHDVLDDLPEIHEHEHEVTLSAIQEHRYGEVLRSIRVGTRTILGSLTTLFGICAHPDMDSPVRELRDYEDKPFPKADKLFEIIDEIAARGEKALVFAGRKHVQRWLASAIEQRYEIERPAIINGAVSGSTSRLAIIDRFAEVRGFACLVLAPRAAGVGLNITAANHVVHYMREWNPAIEKQATDRAYRIGQERPVHVHTIVCRSPLGVTVEQRLAELLAAKKRLITEFTVPMGAFDVSPEELAAANAWLDQGPSEEAPTPHLAPPRPLPRPSVVRRDTSDLDARHEALAARAAVLALPDELLEALDHRARAVLVLLAENGEVRVSDLADQLGIGADRVSSYMTKLRRELLEIGITLFDAHTAADGEPLFAFIG